MKRLIRGAARWLGYDIIRRRPTAFEIQHRMLGVAQDIVILDVGAHFGAVSRIYRDLFPKAALHAFEPSPEAFKVLKSSFDGDRHYHAHQIALCDREGEAELNINNLSATNSLLPTDSNAPVVWQPLVKTEEMVTVPTQTLDAFCNEHQIDSIDILKLDVQGAEKKVLAGAVNLLNRRAIKTVYLEMIIAPTYVGQSRPDEIFGLMNDGDLSLVDIYDIGRSGPLLLQFDALFSCPDSIASLR
jgi:FkbM family methyltransferase